MAKRRSGRRGGRAENAPNDAFSDEDGSLNGEHADALVVVTDALVDSPDIDRLIASWFAGLAPTSRTTYTKALRRFARFVREPSWKDALGGLLMAAPGEAYELSQRFRARLEDDELAPGTVARMLTTLSSATKEAKRLGWIGWTLDPRRPKVVPYRDTRGPGLEAVRRIFDTLDRQRGAFVVRDRAVLSLLCHLLLRRSEISSLDLDHVDVDAAKVWAKRKGTPQRVLLSLPDATCSALSRWLDLRGHRPGPLFWRGRGRALVSNARLGDQGIWRVVRRWADRAGLRRVWPHGLRHTGTTEAIRRAQALGYGIEEVLDLTGHAAVSTLMRYLDRERCVQVELSEILVAAFHQDEDPTTSDDV